MTATDKKPSMPFDDWVLMLKQHGTLIDENKRLKEKGYILVMLALQSHRYAHNPDFQEAVDNLLTAIKLAEGKEV